MDRNILLRETDALLSSCVKGCWGLGAWFLLGVCLLVLAVDPVHADAAKPSGLILFVSPDGNDAWSGKSPAANADRSDGPLKTFTAARDKVRQFRAAGVAEGSVSVFLRGGNYVLDRPLEFNTQDSGTKDAPVVYSAYQDEAVRLIGGREVSFGKLSDPAYLGRFKKEFHLYIVQADLKAQGIADFGSLRRRGFGLPIVPAGLELFFQEKPMPLVRWPNTGWVKIDNVPNGQDGGVFSFTESQPQTWAADDDIWVHGYWTQDWADSYERVKIIDPAAKTIETHPPHGVYGYTAKQRYRVLNAAEELDTPGEWYLDRKTGKLYFWPPQPLEGDLPIVSVLETAVSMKDCSHVILRNLVIECTRGTAVKIQGGSGNRITGCTIGNIGNVGISISGGSGHGVQGCRIYETGDGGVSMSGGDVLSLEPGGHFVEDCHLHHFGRWCLTYRPAIGIDGVGNRASHNLIHDGPHSAIHLGGNDHMVEYNEIHDVCTESDDVGAIYSGRSWVCRGTVIRHNYFHHIHSAADQYLNGSRVVYLDDAASGFTVFGNVFYKAGSLCAINVGGGRDNTICNNIFIECKKGVLIDGRGLEWAKEFISQGGDWHMYEKLEKVRHDQPPYSERYPGLASILDESPAEPRGNKLINNVAVRTVLLDMKRDYQPMLVNQDNWSTDADPGFEDETKGNFALKRDSEIFTHIPPFERIDFEKIGPRRSR